MARIETSWLTRAGLTSRRGRPSGLGWLASCSSGEEARKGTPGEGGTMQSVSPIAASLP